MSSNQPISTLTIGTEEYEILNLVSNNYSLSEDYQIELQIKTAQEIDHQKVLHQQAELKIQGKLTASKIYGIITYAAINAPNFCTLKINSLLNPLQNQKHNRNFIRQTLPEIIQTVLTGHDYQLKLIEKYTAQEFIAQKDESDYDFLIRHLNHNGLFFTFNGKQLIITDDIDLLPGKSEITLKISNDEVRPDESAFAFATEAKLLPKTVILKDYNEATPSVDLTVRYDTKIPPANGTIYTYGEHYQTIEQGAKLAKKRMEAIDWQRKLTIIDTDCPSLIPGQSLILKKYYENSQTAYRIIKIEFKADQNTPYTNIITLIPKGISYRHPTKPKPIHGYCYGTIESSVDYKGKYWIKLKHAQENNYVFAARLMQPAAGKDHGFHYPLKPGTEVLIGYLNGDQNRPIILGAIPSQTMPSPVTVFNSYDNIIRTSSGNQLLMQDLPGSEQITLATAGSTNQLNLNINTGINLASNEGKLNITANQDLTQKTQANYNQTIGTDHKITISNDSKLTVEQDHKQDIQETASIFAKNQASLESKTGEISITSSKGILHAEGSVNLLAEQNLNIQNTTGDLLFKGKKFFAHGKTVIIEVGKASITMTPDGTMTLRGTKVDMKYEHNTQQADQSLLGGTPAAGQEPKIPEPPQTDKIGKIEPGPTKRDIIKVARGWNGTPYAHEPPHGENHQFAGMNAKKKIAGDCSGTTYAIYQEAGYDYKYVTVEQFVKTSGNHKFKEISFTEAKPGDVVTWYNQYGYTYDNNTQTNTPLIDVHHMAIIDTVGKELDGSDTHIWSAHSGKKSTVFGNKSTIKGFSDDFRSKGYHKFKITYWHRIGYNDSK
jgi:type VI secretion system secreted protein VgrG